MCAGSLIAASLVLATAASDTYAAPAEESTPSPSASPSAIPSGSETVLPSIPLVPLPSPTATGESPAPPALVKNVILLLADDLEWSAFNEVPRLVKLQELGTTLTNFVVTESLCCPSRSSIYRSQYIHSHRVLSNIPTTEGGWSTYFNLRHDRNDLPIWLQKSGIETAHIGKYLNGFPGDQPRTYVPPGWDHFVTTVNGNRAYTGYNYVLASNGRLSRAGGAFLNDVLTDDATAWLQQAREPFYLELNSYLPHTPAPSSPKNASSHFGAKLPRNPVFNGRGMYEPKWLKGAPFLTPSRIANLDRKWEKRLASVETFADSVDAVLETLRATAHDKDTLVIVTSDNGYHLGARRLATGKHTPFREDTVVPAVLIGPGIARGKTIDAMTSTVDIAPTIASYLGAGVPAFAEGRDLRSLLANPAGPWRTGALSEHLAAPKPGDPDFDGVSAPKYRALRTKDWLYVQYPKYATLHNRRNDPYELNNVIGSTPLSTIRMLRDQLNALAKCSGARCRVADAMPVPPAPGSPTAPEGIEPSPDVSSADTEVPPAEASPSATPSAEASPIQ
ncbi:MAG: hypothetical protein RJB01_1364 [Actinomycetota bacterium]